jgi:hypothetical protein
VSLSSASASAPSFTANTLAAGTASATYIFSLTVTDDKGNASQADTVTITVQSGPTVAIGVLPSDFIGVASFDVTITFSKTVTGFVADDITVSGGSVVNLTGSGTTYTASIITNGNGNLSLSVPADVAIDSVGNSNAASDTATVSNGLVEETQEAISDFVQNRAQDILNTVPDLGGFLTGGFGGSVSRNINLKITDGSAFVNVSGSLLSHASSKNYTGKTDVWTQLRYVGSDSGTSSARSMIGYLGAHRFTSENMLYGVALQFDYSHENDSAAGSNGGGRGFMLGPYVAGKMKNSNLRYEAQASWGASFNNISPTGAYTDTYRTQRWFLRGKLEGSMQRGLWTIDPGVSVAYFTDNQEEYVDSLSNTIAAQSVTIGEIKVGPKFKRDMDFGFANPVSTQIGIAGVTNFAIQETAGSQAFPLGNGDVRARLDLGLSTTTRNGMSLSASGFLDGIGVSNYSSYGGTLRAEWNF